MSAHDQTDWDSLVQGKTRRVKVGSISVSFDKLTRTSSDSDDFHDLQTSQDFTQLDKIYQEIQEILCTVQQVHHRRYYCILYTVLYIPGTAAVCSIIITVYNYDSLYLQYTCSWYTWYTV
jgi:hypothetical protein